MSILSFCNTYLCGPALPVLLFAAGIYLAVILRGYPLRAPHKMISVLTKKEKGGQSPFRAATLALAGTLGVGNIAGVASAIAIGGAGAVFWMWISGLLAMFVKYAETVLAMRHRVREGNTFHGGAMYYMKRRIMGVTFASICLFSSFFLGNLIQAKAASEALELSCDIPPFATGLLLCVLVCAVIGGGARKISDWTVRIIPALSLGYIFLSLLVLLCRIQYLGAAFSAIFSQMFSFSAAAGGGIGSVIVCLFRNPAMRYGVARGLMSNEAGCGTAPMAHASSDGSRPAEQGLWGVFEVFCDTVLLCTLTALVILVTDPPMHEASSGMDLAIFGFSSAIGGWAGKFLGISAFLFAFASMLCWAYYAMECMHFLRFSAFGRLIFIFLYSLCALYGSISSATFAWQSADLSVGLMTIMNTVFLCCSAREIQEETLSFFQKKKGADLHRHPLQRKLRPFRHPAVPRPKYENAGALRSGRHDRRS